jgi:hypothetical protein
MIGEAIAASEVVAFMKEHAAELDAANTNHKNATDPQASER